VAKLTGAKKKAFLERMAKGRRKAARSNPKKKAAKRKPAKKKAARPAKRKPAKKRKPAARQQNRSIRKSKKVIGKGFSKPVASEWARGKRRKARAAKRTARNGNGYVVWPTGRPFQTLRQAKAFANKLVREGERGVYVENVDTEKTVYRPSGNRKRRNQDDGTDMYETFHGKKPGRIVEYDELINFPQHFAELGRLVELRINLDSHNRKFPFTSFGNCKVVCTPDGENIYFVGGDQKIDLGNLDIGGDKDMVELGPCVYICYHTTKDFHDFTPIDYFHEFGEEDGIQPMLAYDRLNQKLFLMGGNYQVKREGIVN
jgi:hypothetical protein